MPVQKLNVESVGRLSWEVNHSFRFLERGAKGNLLKLKNKGWLESWPDWLLLFDSKKKEKNCRLARFLLKSVGWVICASRNLDHAGWKSGTEKLREGLAGRLIIVSVIFKEI